MALAATRRPWRFRTRQFLWATVDLVFPPQCAGCGRPGQRFCADCRLKLTLLQPPFCQRCGYPVRQAGLCELCDFGVNRLSALAGVRSAAFFEGPLQTAIHQLKYRGDLILADDLAGLMLAGAAEDLPAGGLVVPVPLAPERQTARGYNQAGLLARTFAERRGLRLAWQGVARVRATGSQVGLSAKQRRVNVAGAFAGQRRVVAGQSIILIDDVCTTGSTLDACAEALLAAGAVQVWGLTLGRARLGGAQDKHLPQPTGAGK
jgi:competence protein ComFC